LKSWWFSTVCCGLALALALAGGSWSYATPAPDDNEVTITTSISDPVEILFRIGLHETQQGNYPSAVKIFSSLAKESSNPRIQLELARALFLDRRYQESAEVFNVVLQEPDLPWTVQENIRAYLEVIDAALGYLRFGFSLITDNNPRNFTDSEQVKVAGQPLRVVEPEDNKEVTGVRYTLNAARVLTKSGWLTGYLNAHYSDFPSSQFDRWTADLGLFLSLRTLPKIKLRAGLEESYYGGDHLYEFPYLGVIYTPDPVFQFRSNTELKVGQLRVPGAGQYDATNLSLTTVANRPLTAKVRVSGTLYLEKSIADEKAYAYYGGELGLGLGFALFQDWGLKPYASVGRRLYEADDPFFGETRRDTRFSTGVSVNKADLKVFGYVPEVELRYDETWSNLDFYSYDKVVFLLNFNE
jgi:tetratricopeptide (TPR) repeat protein